MKVLFLTNVPSPYRVCFFNELGKLCDLTVLYELTYSADRNKNWQEFCAQSYKEIYLKGKRTDVGMGKCPEVKKYLTKEYDVIVVGAYASPTQQIAIRYLHAKKIPFIINSDGGFIQKNELFLKKWYKSYLIKKASACITSGESSVKYLEYYGAKKEKIFVYPFTSVYDCDIIDVDKLSELRIKAKEELKITHKRAVISVGSFYYGKGMDIILKAAKAFREEDIGFYFVGGEPTEEYLELSKENKNIVFVNHLTKTELFDYYKACDVFALMTRSDVWGLVINEAMANGLPVITTEMCNAGNDMITNGESGYILPVDDVKGLEERLREILGSDEKLLQMSINSVNVAKKYTYENMAKVHMEIFEKMRG